MANIQYRVSEGNPSSDQPFLDSHWTHYVAMASVIALVIVFGVLVTITAIGVARIETAHPVWPKTKTIGKAGIYPVPA